MPFALTNHFDRGTCPQLVLNWVRDTHYGPPVDSSHASDGVPALQMNQIQHFYCSLIHGSPTTSSLDLLQNYTFGLIRPLIFHPQARLLWYTHTAAWTTNFHRLPQVQLSWTPTYAIVVRVISQMPCRWAWISESRDTWWDPTAQDIPDDLSSQQQVFQHALLELEHVLSRHCVLSSVHHALTREYVRRRSLIPDLLDVLGSHVKRPRTQTGSDSTQISGKGRSRGRYNSSDSSSTSDYNPLIQLLAKLCLRQEDMLNQMNLDRSFMLFIQVGKGSILSNLFMASQEWHLQKQQAGVTCPLRQVLFLKMVEELVQRTSAFQIENKEDALCTNLRSKLILTEDNAWNYMAWDASAKFLRPTK